MLLTVLHAAPASADDFSESSQEAPVEGESLWIEDKINPATRWLEQLVSPVTTWMEDKIQDNQNRPREIQQWQPESDTRLGPDSPQTPPDTSETHIVITSDEAVAVAVAAQPGEVLRVKLLDREKPAYRVKLITDQGEIQILYVDAVTGDILN